MANYFTNTMTPTTILKFTTLGEQASVLPTRQRIEPPKYFSAIDLPDAIEQARARIAQNPGVYGSVVSYSTGRDDAAVEISLSLNTNGPVFVLPWQPCDICHPNKQMNQWSAAKAEHKATLTKHKTALEKHQATLKRHEASLKRHEATFEKRKAAFEEHKATFKKYKKAYEKKNEVAIEKLSRTVAGYMVQVPGEESE